MEYKKIIVRAKIVTAILFLTNLHFPIRLYNFVFNNTQKPLNELLQLQQSYHYYDWIGLVGLAIFAIFVRYYWRCNHCAKFPGFGWSRTACKHCSKELK